MFERGKITINGCKIKSSSVIASLNVNVYHTHDH